MLAEIGFLVTGVCFAMFAYTFKTLVVDKTKLALEQFAWAYFFLALALITWGVAIAIGGDLMLKNSILLGDFFLLCGTLLMLDLLLGAGRRFWLVPAGALALLALNYRADNYPPMPYIQSNILVLNTQTAVAVVIGLIFLIIWLPVNLRVARQVTSHMKEDRLSNIYACIYLATTILALVFAASRRKLTLLLSLAALVVCFLMIFASNVVVEALGSQHTAKSLKKNQMNIQR